MISVSIMVIVMIILISTVAVSAISSISNAKKINFKADIAYIQDEVDNYYIKSGYLSYPTKASIIIDITTVSPNELYQFTGEIIDENNKIIMNEIDFDIIGIKQHVYGNNESEADRYLVSTVTGKVYYIAGVKSSGKTFYTMVPELNKEYKRKAYIKSNEIVIDDVILELSTVEYTNNPVTVKVKLPVEYTYGSVTASNSKVIAAEVINAEYKERDINYTGASRDGNYSIAVNYTKDGIDKTVRYMVKNFDKTLPTISNISQSISKNPSDGKVLAYILFDDPKDNLSGIKTVKYAEENVTNIDAKVYFENNGRNVVNNKITIKNYAVYTIYVEDNAGNISIYNVIIEPNILVEIE